MCYSDWFIQVNLPLHHHRCYVKRKIFVFWSKLLWRSLTYQLLLNKCQPCQHSQITWQIKEVLPYSCHKRDALWPVHSRDEMDLTGHILQWKWAGGRQLFWLSAAPTPVRIWDQTGGVRNTNDRAQRWCGIFPSSPCGYRWPPEPKCREPLEFAGALCTEHAAFWSGRRRYPSFPQ